MSATGMQDPAVTERCLVVRGDMLNDTARFVTAYCADRLEKKSYADVASIWIHRADVIHSLVLGCPETPVSDSGLGGSNNNTCFCADFLWITHNSSTNVIGRAWDDIQTIGDAYRCSHPRSLSKTMLQGLSGLESLILGTGSFTELDPGALGEVSTSLQQLQFTDSPAPLSSLPPGLLCPLRSLRLVSLVTSVRQQTRTIFPRQIFVCQAGSSPQVGAVLFAGYSVEYLPESLLGNATQVTVLVISHTGVTRIHPHAFTSYVELHTLHLTFNDISDVPGELFNLGDLQVLNLTRNTLRYVDTRWFAGAASIRTLDLSYNGITWIANSFSVMPRLLQLDLSHNSISNITSLTFQGAYSLAKLYLSDNMISDIAWDAFRHLLFLRTLDLNANRLWNSTALRQCFHGSVERMSVLLLQRNNLTELLDNMFQLVPTYMTQLRAVDLSFNQITSIDPSAFRDMDQLELVQLWGNRLSGIEDGTFDKLPSLQYLWLQENRLESVPYDMAPGSVRWLSLTGNLLSEFPRLSKPLPRLQEFHLADNNIRHLTAAMVQHLPAVKTFNMSSNRLETLGPGTFAGMTSLVGLDLSTNHLNLNFSVDYLGNQHNLLLVNLSRNHITSAENLFLYQFYHAEALDLSHNPLQTYPGQPKFHPSNSGWDILVGTTRFYLRKCSLTDIEPTAFTHMVDLGLLDLSDNHLSEFGPLQISRESDNYYVYLNGNPVQCSCRMKWLRDMTYRHHYRINQCVLPTTNRIASFQSVTDDRFLCRAQRRCLVDVTECECFSNNLTTGIVTYVLCNNRQLRRVPAHLPQTAAYIYLNGNNFHVLDFSDINNRMDTVELFLDNSSIADLRSGTFRTFPYLKVLTLNGNNLHFIRENAFAGLYHLKILKLDHNQIQIVEQGTFSDTRILQELYLHANALALLGNTTLHELSLLPSLQTLTIHDNPWQCRCDNLTFKYWIQSLSGIIPELGRVDCNGTPILELEDVDFLCYDPVRVVHVPRFHGSAVAATAVCAGLVLLCLVTLLAAYKHRVLLQVLLYHRFGWRLSKRQEDPDAKYDAYVAYDKNNLSTILWIKNHLIPRLEPNFRLYVPDRDSIPGHVETDEIIQNLETSRRSLFLLTESGLQNELLLYTFQMAHHRVQNLSQNRHHIVLTLMDGVDSELVFRDAEPHFRAFLSMKHYLTLGDRYFWKRLNFQLPAPSRILKDGLAGTELQKVVL